MSEKPPIGDAQGAVASESQTIEAASWIERLSHAPDETTQAAFESWYAASSSNARAYEKVYHTHGFAKRVADQSELIALRQQTLARAVLGREIVRQPSLPNLRKRADRHQEENFRSGRPVAFGLGIAVGLAACLVGGAWLFTGQHIFFQGIVTPSAEVASADTLYRTGVGEQATIELSDGSKINLNTGSSVRVAYSNTERRLLLEHGQAFFTVAKDVQRPFTVEANGKVVTAYGTAFDVRIQSQKLHVALLEGQVSVGPSSTKRQGAVMLRPNEMLIADKNAVKVVRVTNPISLTAWRDGVLVFQNDKLESAVEEINRYNQKRIIIADDDVSKLRISGTFKVGNTSSFVNALDKLFSIKVLWRENEIILSKK